MLDKNNLLSFLLLLALVFSCKPETEQSIKNQKTDSIVKIELNSDTLNTPLRRSLNPFRFLNTDTIDFTGIPNIDTLSVQYLTLISQKKITKWRELGLLNERIGIKNRLYAISGFLGNKQIIILDVNFNKDFSDDKVIAFDRSTRFKYEDNLEPRDSLSSFLIRNIGFEGKEPIETALYLKAFPIYDNPKLDKEKYLRLVAEEKQYYKGDFTIDSINYKVALDNTIFGATILIERKENKFKSLSEPDSFTYRLKDTLYLAKNYYRIDSISPMFQTAYLKTLDIKEKRYGFRKGYKLKDFDIQPIDSINQTSIKTLLAQKPYLLFDFWGTWCAPCIELTPDLIEIKKSYQDNLNIVSIAVEPKLDNVKRYIKKNQLDWYHHHIKMNPKSSREKSQILEDLAISSYPTFILIDQDQNIVYRGSGDALTDIKAFLSKSLK